MPMVRWSAAPRLLAQGARSGGHDGSFLIVDRVGREDFVVGVRSHTGEVMRVYLMDADIEKLMEFLRRKHD
jgi:GGDEF domain-containing protein